LQDGVAADPSVDIAHSLRHYCYFTIFDYWDVIRYILDDRASLI
jgi:hypothetical protein